MAIPSNILQQVITYQRADLALLQNYSCFLHTANTKFKDFQNLTAQLGQTVNFELPLRTVGTNSLIANFEPLVQRFQPLTTDQQYSVSLAIDASQYVYNDLDEYIARQGNAIAAEIGAKVEGNVATLCETAPYRFYYGNISGSNVGQINSYTQLSQALAQFRNYGATTMRGEKIYMLDVSIPAIVAQGLNQFAVDRNNEIANSWMVGNYDMAKFYRSNLLPTHVAGSAGQGAQVLTVISIDVTGTLLTVSGLSVSDPNAIKIYDSLYFLDNVSGQPDMRYLTFIGYFTSSNPVQVRATANVASDVSGNAVIPIYPPLIFDITAQNNNLNNPIAAGMQLMVLDSHRCGMIVGGDAMYIAMPKLPPTDPFPYANEPDPDTGVSLRLYYGYTFGQNQYGYIRDCIWGKTAVPEYTMKMCFPLIIT